MIEFKKIDSDESVVEFLVNLLGQNLSMGRRVFWLLAGGSAMDVAVQVAKKIGHNEGLERLVVSLTDERYGPPGFKDSNWQQLIDKGFDLPGAQLLPVLNGTSLKDTERYYEQMLRSAISNCDISIALAGMGPDGHIFGIKPGSPAVSTDQDVAGYEWDDYVRITPTINFIKKLDEVIIYAMGPEKHSQIDKLAETIPADEQPAQLLKVLGHVVFFNDYKEGNL